MEILIRNLSKNFGKLEVLKQVNLRIAHQGSITAILGPNSSGKTTLIKILLGMILPTQGDIFINNQSILNQWKYRKDIGYMPQITDFPENLRVKELVYLVQSLRKKNAHYDTLIRLFGIKPHWEEMLKNLSGGTKQKINIILNFMFDNTAIILDEPTNGLDPLAVMSLKKLLVQEKKKNKIIVITTHIINLVEELADEIIFLLEGKIYFQGSCQGLKQKYHASSLEQAIVTILHTQ